MANTINYTVAYMNMLDGIYKADSATAILTAGASKYRFSTQDDKTVYLKKVSVNGMGTYSRVTGYVAGDSTIEWEAHTFSQDRGRKYNLDAMDAVEAKTQIAELMAEVMRTQLVPEIDAYRFEKICTLCGLDVSADLTVDTAIQAIDTAVKTLDDAEAPKQGRVLFVSNNMHSLMKQSGEHFNVRLTQSNNGIINRNIDMFDDMPLIKVPVTRFKNNFDFYDGTTGGQTAGGFVANASAKDINFMIVPISEIIAIIKHMSPKIVTPELNQTSDGWLFAYRCYHDLFIADNKVNGIYVHTKA